MVSSYVLNPPTCRSAALSTARNSKASDTSAVANAHVTLARPICKRPRHVGRVLRIERGAQAALAWKAPHVFLQEGILVCTPRLVQHIPQKINQRFGSNALKQCKCLECKKIEDITCLIIATWQRGSRPNQRRRTTSPPLRADGMSNQINTLRLMPCHKQSCCFKKR